MKIQYLREFISLIETKSFTLASERLFVSQPTLSRHIKEMEEELGCELIDRSTRKVSVTDYGLIVLTHAMDIINAENAILDKISTLKREADNRLFFGCINPIQTFTADVIQRFVAQNPESRFSTIVGESDDLFAILKTGKLDFAFIREDISEKDDGYERITIATDPMRVMVSSSHPLAGSETIHITELKDEVFLMSEDTSLSYKQGTSLARSFGIELNVLFQGTKTQLQNLVEKGLGVSLLFTDPGHSDNVSISVIEPIVESNINCVYDPKNANIPKYAGFISFMKDNFAI